MQKTHLVLLLLTLCWPGVLHAQNSSKSSDTAQERVDLRSVGFPTNSNPVVVADVRASIFFLSNETLALYFEQRTAATTPPSYRFTVVTFNTTGQVIAHRVFRADGKSFDVSSGPNDSILLRESERLDFFDTRLQFVKSYPLPSKTVGESFDRASNQLVVITMDERSGNRNARFLNANTFEELTVLAYPKRSRVVFGKKQLGFTLPGNCIGALHVQPDPENWKSVENLETCDALTFVGNESLAYATSQDLAVMATMKHGLLARKPGTWPYYNEIFVYDLSAKKLLFKHALTGGYAAAFSPDGHHLATIESGSLNILSIP